MDKLLFELIKNKKVCILGFGREGRSTLKKLLEVKGFDSLTVVDIKDVSKDCPSGVNCIFGEGYLDCLDDFDLVFKTPGVVLKKELSEYKCKFTSETEVFISAFKDKVIGITGTKGKSTTSSFLYHVLKTAGKNVLFAGNIGIPVFDIASEVRDDSIIVIELSCHQLEYINVSPHISILLNVYEDHLDHYGTREKYGLSKKNIYKYQDASDFLFTTKEVIDEWGPSKSKVTLVSKDMCPIGSFEEIKGASLRGEHNLLNITFAYLVSKMFMVSLEDFELSVKTFETLPHRLEYVGCIEGIDYYDDSISTTVKSSISAVKSIDNSAVLLLGGMERNIDYTELVSFIKDSRLKFIICMYESGKRIFDMYEALKKVPNSPKAIFVNDLFEAVKKAKEVAKKGEAVLLSPASASYGYFKNFEERGDTFKQLVQ